MILKIQYIFVILHRFLNEVASLRFAPSVMGNLESQIISLFLVTHLIFKQNENFSTFS